VLVLCIAGAAGAAAALATSGGGATRTHASTSQTRPFRPASHRRGGLGATIATGNAEIRRLAGFDLPLYCGGHRGNEVAFTFDDGPGVYTNLALKKLGQAHERATFFVVGKSMNAFPGFLPRELALGTIGDHTYTHPDLVALSPAEVDFQLARTAQMIRAQTGQEVDLWRPPYEADDAAVRQVAHRLGLLEILWSIDSRDSLGADWAQIISTVEAGLRPGTIVLFHENHGQTIRALTTLLPYLHSHRLRSVSLPELLASDPPSIAQLRAGATGCGGSTALKSAGHAGG